MKKADIVLKSNTIFTSENLDVVSGAIAIKGEKILAVITDESQLAQYIDDKTQVIDYGDKLICPGFIDPHFHFNLTAIANSPYALILNETNSEAECIQAIVDQRKRLPEADRIYGFGWLNTAWENPAFPTKESLDRVCPDIPVYLLSRDGHNWWFNTKAIEESGITPETELLYGNWEIDETGELTGIGIDNDVTTKVCGYALKLDKSILKKVAYDFMQDLNKAGITSIAEPAECPGISGSHQYFEAYDELDRDLDGGVPVRMFLVPSLGTNGDFTLVKSLRERYKSDKVRVCGLKQFIDGVTMIHTAYTLEPYADDPSVELKPLVSREILQPIVNAANREGFSVRLHAISDGSARLGLDIFEESQKQCDMTGIVNTLEHLDNLDPADIPRFAQLGVIPSMQPSHMSLTDSYFVKTLGEKRAKYAYMHKELLENGATLAFGTDNPCTPYSPFENLYYAVTRCDFEGKPLTHNPKQAVTLGEAVRSYTHGSSCAVLADNMIGTLTPGKYADLVVVDGPMFGEDPKEFLKRKPILTMSAGKVVYNG